MTQALGREVKAQEIPRDKWGETLKHIGFLDDSVKNFIKMSELVAEGEAKLQGDNPIRLRSTLKQFLQQAI